MSFQVFVSICLICVGIVFFLIYIIKQPKLNCEQEFYKGYVIDKLGGYICYHDLKNKSFAYYLCFLLATVFFSSGLYGILILNKKTVSEYAFSIQGKNFLLNESNEKENGKEFIYNYDGKRIDISIINLSNIETKKENTNITIQLKNNIDVLNLQRKSIRSDYKNEVKRLRDVTKQNIQNIKKEYKNVSKQNSIIASLKGDTDLSYEEMKEVKLKAKEIRDTNIQKTKAALKVALIEVKKVMNKEINSNNADKNLAKKDKWLKQETGEDVSYKKIVKSRLYIVKGESSIKDINVQPFGFCSGVFDGFYILTNIVKSFFPLDVVVYKKENNGISYLFGYLIGLIGNLVFIVWLGNILLFKSSQKRISETWKLSNDDQRAFYYKSVYESKDRIVNITYEIEKKKLESSLNNAEEEYKELKKEYFDNKGPETVLNKLKSEKRQEKKNGNDNIVKIVNIVTAGASSRIQEENRYSEIVEIYDYYSKRYKIVKIQAELAEEDYKYIVEKAFLFAKRIKEIEKRMIVKDRELLDRTKNLNLEVTKTEYQIEDDYLTTINEVKDFRLEFNIKTENAMNEQRNYNIKVANKLRFGDDLSTADKMSNVINGINIVVTSVGTLLNCYAEEQEFNGRVSRNYAEQTNLIIKQIGLLEKNRLELQKFIARENEVSVSVQKALEGYEFVYREVYNLLYPLNDDFKTRVAREQRKHNQDDCFTLEEKIEINKLKPILRFLMAIIDAEY